MRHKEESDQGGAGTESAAAIAHVDSARPDDMEHPADRRSTGDRRTSRLRLSDDSNALDAQKNTMVPRDWSLSAILPAASLLGGALVCLSLPDLLQLALAIFGVAAALMGKRARKRAISGEGAAWITSTCGWVTLVGPMISSGWIISEWTQIAGLHWAVAVAVLITCTAMSTSLLSGQVVPQLVTKFACWAPIALYLASPMALGAIAFGGIAAAIIGRHQWQRNEAVARDSMARKRVRNRAQDILRDYEETGQGWFWETDRRGLLTYVSPSVAVALGKGESSLLNRPFTDLFNLNGGNQEGERTLAFHLSARSSFQELGVLANTYDEERWWSVSGRPAYDDFGNFMGFRGSGTDLTERKRNEESVTRLAQYDSLTGLANRFQMTQLLAKILTSPSEAQRECSVFLLDLDRFKHVNDTLGHPAGDALLKQVSQRLERAVGNAGRVGRLGGDEFEVIIPGRSERSHLTQLAQEIIHSLSQPYLIEGQRVVIGASVGIAIAPVHGNVADKIVRNADLALYAAKDGGRGRFHVYSSDLHTAVEERSKLEQALRDAIANGDLELHYQPVVLAKENRIAGFEGLLRWKHPEKGWMSPAKFIPIAEDTGLITAIGEWAIRTACQDLARWPEKVRCAVNVSALQFSNPQLPVVVTNAIAQAGIDPSRLELEITETVFLNDSDGTDAMFTALKRIGVRLALDDFGTGYSSLGYLRKAPFDKIKIDQGFVRGATQPGNRNGAIIESITGLAKSLGMDTTAEGVETLDELELVRKLGCSHVQGYIYSKALPVRDVTVMLANGLELLPQGPRSARPARQTMLRRVALEHGGHVYEGTIRNMSYKGVMVEGLWNVPEGTCFNIAISRDLVVRARAIWSDQNRTGLMFDRPLTSRETAGVIGVGGAQPAQAGQALRKAG